MRIIEKFREFLDFNLWANDLLLQNLSSSESEDKEVIKIFGHILLAEREWFKRFAENKTDATGADFWETAKVEDCQKLFAGNKRYYQNFFAGLTEEKLCSKTKYKNSKGQEFTNTLDEVLSHVFFHSAQHRGQIIKIIRANGETPPYIDFIGFLRSKS